MPRLSRLWSYDFCHPLVPARDYLVSSNLTRLDRVSHAVSRDLSNGGIYVTQYQTPMETSYIRVMPCDVESFDVKPTRSDSGRVITAPTQLDAS